MKQFTIIATFCVGIALAGVGHLSPGEEQQKWDLFNRYCRSGGGAEYGQNSGSAWIFCKRAPHVWREDYTHEVSKNLGSGHTQEIFVQPAPLELNHRVVVNARLEGGRTKVYVVPNDVNNRYQVDVRGEGGKAEKPTVYYLKHGSSSSIPTKSGYPSQPEPQYGLPNRDLVEYPSSISVVPRQGYQ